MLKVLEILNISAVGTGQAEKIKFKLSAKLPNLIFV
jgi:hypothetical protein